MDSMQLTHVLRSDRFTRPYFQGVFPSDCLRHLIPKLPCAVVVNTDPSHRPGAHWVAIFISKNGVGDYFDSYGLPPSATPDIEKFLNRHCVQHQSNNVSLQGLFSTVCGQYTVFFLLHRCRGIEITQITGWFTRQPRMNDEMVNDFITRRFSCVNIPVYDLPFMMQLSTQRTS